MASQKLTVVRQSGQVLDVFDVFATMEPQWQFALVDGFTQSRKTWRAFELVCQNVNNDVKTLALFVTQANNVSVVHQVMSRCSQDPNITRVYKHIHRARGGSAANHLKNVTGNVMLVDFWHAKNTKAMEDFVKAYKPTNIFAIIDEVDQAGLNGVAARLDFLRRLHVSSNATLRVVLVTATVANLSKHFLTLSQQSSCSDKTSFTVQGVVGRLIKDKCIRHCYVKPDASYVGPSWFRKNDLWHPLVFPRKPARLPKEDHECAKLDVIVDKLRQIPTPQKQLCLIVAVSKISRQKQLITRLLAPENITGFNVIVELNSDKTQKNYNVYYLSREGGLQTWNIPHAQMNYILKKGGVDGWTEETEIPLPYLMQACAFMGTEAESRIKKNIDAGEYARLRSLSNVLHTGIKRKYRRPSNYPQEPRVAIVAGNIAGRGTTFQLAHIDFVCTSFFFAGGTDKVQRGATNAQRFGRACGLLGDIFVEPGRKPVLITTPNVFEDALANERALEEKARACGDDALVCMKDLVSPDEWDSILADAKAAVARKCVASPPKKITPVVGMLSRDAAIIALLQMLVDNGGSAVLKYKDIKDHNNELHDYLKKQNKRLLNEFVTHFKYLKKLGMSRYELTDAGRHAYETVSSNP